MVKVCSDILPPPSLAMDGGFVRPMLRILNTSRYRTCADRTFCRGTLYESAVSQQVSSGTMAKISSGEDWNKTQPSTGCPLSISTQTGKGRFAPLCPRVQCVSYGWRIPWYSLKDFYGLIVPRCIAMLFCQLIFDQD